LQSGPTWPPVGPSGIWLVNSDGSGSRPFTPNCTDTGTCTAPGTSAAAWAPDGVSIAYLEAGLDGVRIRTRDGTGLTTLDVPPACCARPTTLSWSPDGDMIAFSTLTPRADGLGNEGRIGLVAVSGGSPTLLTPAGAHVALPVWRP
jgi:Tol biopolymer transport system component